MQSSIPTVKDVVLVGGGHSHVEVLRAFGMRPLPGARLTLITKNINTPYSGMLPGYVAGFYSYEEVHIDLCKLSRFACSRLIHAEVTGVDLRSRKVLFNNRPPISYDVLSIDIGSTPKLNDVPGAADYTTSVKPISTFVDRFQELLKRVRQKGPQPPASSTDEPGTSTDFSVRKLSGVSLDPSRRSVSPAPSTRSEPSMSTTSAVVRRATTRRLGQRGFCMVVVGGGAGGVELALALQHRLLQEMSTCNDFTINEPNIKLVSRKNILSTYPSGMRSMFLKILHEKGIEVYEKNAVREVSATHLTLRDGFRIEFDGCLWCTEASAAPWIKTTELPTDNNGFIRINNFLQPFYGPSEVFASGDIATSVAHPRPKAGVFAVRQGPPLATNIRKYLLGEELVPYIPQSTYLSLISTGDKHCAANKGWFCWQASALWTLKDTIDRNFMNKYGRDLPDMEKKMKTSESVKPLNEHYATSLLEKQAAVLYEQTKMRCAGCGGKVGMNSLKRVLKDVYQLNKPNISQGEKEDSPPAAEDHDQPSLAAPQYDDAALIQPPPAGYSILQTTDFLRSFITDPFVFGQISALHCLSDVYAMGGDPKTVLATATVPFAAEDKMEADLFQLMSGAKQVCDDAGCEIVGGHSSEGTDMHLGFSVLGLVKQGGEINKTGISMGESFILTKALGTGVILAAEMRGKCRGAWLESAVQSMLTSNHSAGQIFKLYRATACTDITGFGLLGHLSEMMSGSKVSVKVYSSCVPVLPGVEDCVRQGIVSSLHPQNAKVRSMVTNFEAVKDHWRFPVIVDPQTNGGLLASIPTKNAAVCLTALHEAGLTEACIIGQTVESKFDPSPMIHMNTEPSV